MAIVPPPVSAFEEIPEVRARRQLRLWVRGTLLVMALVPAGVFAVALWLDPYRGGKIWLEETHTQLGFKECTFKSLTGLPCPSCGMTSSFALFVRGDLGHSLQANFAGTALALFSLAFMGWAAFSSASGKLVWIRCWERVLVRVVVGFMILMFGRWAAVLVMDYWKL